MEGGRIRPSYCQGQYGVVPPRVPDIVAIIVQQIRLPLHTSGRRHPRRFPASVEEQGDDHCGGEPSRCVSSWQRTFRSAHQGETCTLPSAACVGFERGGGATGTADVSSQCSCFGCVDGLSLCSTQFSLVVS